MSSPFIAIPICGSDHLESLNGVTTGNGTTLDNGGALQNHTLVVVPSGTVTGGNVHLQGSPDNIHWITLNGINSWTGQSAYAASGTGAYRYIRAAILTGDDITGGGTISAFVSSAP